LTAVLPIVVPKPFVLNAKRRSIIACLLVFGAVMASFPSSALALSQCAIRKVSGPSVVLVGKPVRMNDTSVTVDVCMFRKKGDDQLGSYHFELYYDTAYARVISAVKPSSGLRVDNTGLSGIVAFAGASTGGFDDGLIESIRFRVRNPLSPALALRVVEANALSHRPLAPIVKIEGAKLSARQVNGIIALRTSTECSPQGPPRIRSVSPPFASTDRSELTEVRITGCGFAALNTVRFGRTTVSEVPSRENGSLIVFMIPKVERISSEAPPMPLHAGSYPLVVQNVRGESNVFTFALR
jgi:hypothetical protein